VVLSGCIKLQIENKYIFFSYSISCKIEVLEKNKYQGQYIT